MAAVKSTLKLAGLFMLLLIVLAASLRHVPIHVHDGFETPHLSWRWSRAKLIRGAAMYERSIVRSGHSALAITVHSGDKYEAASDDGLANERAELLEPRGSGLVLAAPMSILSASSYPAGLSNHPTVLCWPNGNRIVRRSLVARTTPSLRSVMKMVC